MSTRWNRISHVSVTRFAALVGAVIFFFALKGISDTNGAEIGCLPPTPSPCIADGICRPNRELFGYSRTRWRPWPGDPLPEQPTPAEETTTEDEMTLEPFEHPAPEEEDTRGPAKTKSFAPPEKDSLPESGEMPAEGVLPEPDQQGSAPAQLHQEDSPPELPQRLRRYVSVSRLRHLSVAQSSPVAQPAKFNLSLPSRGSRRAAGWQPGQQIQRLPLPSSAIVQATAELPMRTSVSQRTGPGLAYQAKTGIHVGNQRAFYQQTVGPTAPDRAR